MHNHYVYTVQDVARILRISTKTVYRLVADGEIACVRVRGQIRITKTMLEQYLKGVIECEQ